MNDIIQKDKELLVFLNNLGSPAFDHFWILVSEKLIWIPLYVIFLYLLAKNFRLNSLIFIIIFIVLGITISDQLAGFFKDGIMRLRPCNDPGLESMVREVKSSSSFGFYSAHSSNSFFIATFMWLMLRDKFNLWFGIFLFSWATMVAYSRVYLGVHFPLDVIVGGAFGFLLGGLFTTLSKNVIQKQLSSK